MQEIMRVLWEYASQYRLDGFYNREAQEGREECARAVEQNRADLEKICPSTVFERVSILYDCAEELRGWDMEAAFACGFQLGLSLR